jgi:hypothetical protein
MADSPPTALSSAPPEVHDDPKVDEPEPGGPSSDDALGEDNPAAADDAAGDDGVQDAASIKTTTEGLFPEDVKWPSYDTAEHRLGLDINYPRGWDGSSFNDYE